MSGLRHTHETFKKVSRILSELVTPDGSDDDHDPIWIVIDAAGNSDKPTSESILDKLYEWGNQDIVTVLETHKDKGWVFDLFYWICDLDGDQIS